MTELDRMLAALRDDPAPAALHLLDDAVFAGLAAGHERVGGRRALAIACTVAAGVGLWGGLSAPLPQRVAVAAHEDGLIGVPAAAPSQLLAS